jgi:acyl carrier protein
MGLDIVEMVIELEKEFGIELPDAELRLAETVGDLFTLVATRSGVPAGEISHNGPEWNRYLDVIERDTGLERSRLQPTARFIRDLGLG